MLSRRSRQRERLSASALSICSSVCLFVCLSPKCKKTRFSQKLSNLELWCLLTTYRKLCKLKNPLLDPYNPRWLRYAILKIDMTSFFFCRGWSDLDKISQTGACPLVTCSDLNSNRLQQVVSFNSTKRRTESFIVSYIRYRFITACN